MKKKIVIIILASLGLVSLSFASEYDDLQILNSDQSGITLVYQVPQYSSRKLYSSEQTYDLISINKATLSQDEGKPWLPVRIVTLGIPFDAEVDVQISEQNSQEFSNIDLAPCPKQETNFQKGEWKLIYQKNAQAYAVNQFLPENLIEIEPPIFIRGQKIVRLKIYPIQYNPYLKTIRHYSELKVSVNFSRIPNKRFRPITYQDRFFEKIFHKTDRVK